MTRAQAGPVLGLPTRPAVLWRQAMPAVMLGAATAQVWRLLDGQVFAWPSTLVFMAVAAGGVVFTFVALPAKASVQHLWLYVWGGWLRRIEWAEVQDVQLGRWLFTPAFHLRTRDGRSLYLPRDTLGLERLHALALQQGGPSHPLVRALETPLYRL
jgi:hypothetical protein